MVEQTIPELDPGEWEHFQSYDLGVTYEQFLQAREYYYAYANSPDLYYADLEVVNGFRDGSDAHAWGRMAGAKLYSEYTLNQPLNSVANVDFAMDALARMPDHLGDGDYFLFGAILFGGAVGGIEFGEGTFFAPDSGKGGRRVGEFFRGGKKKARDRWYGYDDKQFQRWWHRRGKADWGEGDISSKEMADAVYQYWVDSGKPKVK